jgi:hypothetical protein
MKTFRGELTRWWPFVSPVEEYAGEALEFLRMIVEQRPRARTALELTHSDLSNDMLAVSRQLNPACDP